MTPQPFFGGQGRSPRDVQDGGESVLALIVLALAAGGIAAALRWMFW